jgi:hypothetical protein
MFVKILMFNYLRLPLFRKYHVGGWFFFAFFGEKNKAIQLDLKKNPTPQKLYFSTNIRKEKLDANEQGFAMLGNLKNVRPEPKPN